MVVETRQIAQHVRLSLALAGIAVFRHPLRFQASEKSLHRCVIPAVATAAHALLGSTPFPRTVLKGLKTSSLAGRLYDAFVGYETVRCSRIDPLLPHRESDRIDGQHVPV